MTLRSMFSGVNQSINSTYRETITTFEFLTGMMKALANKNKKLDILMTKVGDSFGYDLVLKCDEIVKYVQLKTTEDGSSWDVHNSLIENSDGVLVVINIAYLNNKNWDLTYSIWDNEKLPTVGANSTTTKINRTMLEQERTIEGLAIYMFKKLWFD